MLAEPLAEALEHAADRFGTPVYVVDLTAVAESAGGLETAFGAPWVRQFSLKANDLPALTEFLAGRGWGANVVSHGEWDCARTAGVPNSAVTFEGIGKTDAELAYAVSECAAGRPLRWLALESPDEALRLAELAAGGGLGVGGTPPLDVLVRVNPAVDPETSAEFAVGAASSKFGMEPAEIVDLARSGVLSGALRLRGVHVHAGSALRDVVAWAAAGVVAVRLSGVLAGIVPGVDTVDFGGGFPVPGDGAPTPQQFAETLAQQLDEHGLTLPSRCAIEPGRALVGHAGWLVGSVLHARHHARPIGQQTAQQVVLDVGMTELMRPALYGSRHAILPLRASDASAVPVTTSVDGPICELTDSFGVHELPALRRGDLVAIAEAGAYAASFTSRYNGRPQPPELLRWPTGELEHCARPAIAAPLGLAPAEAARTPQPV